MWNPTFYPGWSLSPRGSGRMGDSTGPHPLTWQVSPDLLELCFPTWEWEHGTGLLGLCGRAEGWRVRAIKHWPLGSYLKKKRSMSLRTVTQLKLVVSLYLANGHPLSPTRLLLQPHSRVCLGKQLRGQLGRPRFPSQSPLPPTHPAENKITAHVFRHPP